MKRIVTLTSSILLCCSMLFAQNNFQPVERALVDGFVILKNGDRLQGRIQVQKPDLMLETVIFFNKINIQQTYRPEEIQSYGLNIVLRNEEGDLKREWRSFKTNTLEEEKSQTLEFVQNSSEETVFMD